MHFPTVVVKLEWSKCMVMLTMTDRSDMLAIVMHTTITYDIATSQSLLDYKAISLLYNAYMQRQPWDIIITL